MTQEEAARKNQECIDNFRQFTVDLDTEVKIAFETAAIIVENEAVSTHPWKNDTEHLQASITHRVIEQGSGGHVQAQIGTNVIYGAYLEFGTEKMRPRPWLFPAFKRKESIVNSIIKQAVKKAIDEAGGPKQRKTRSDKGKKRGPRAPKVG